MNKQEFCQLLTGYFGEPIDKLEQQVSITFTGDELYEFSEFILKKEWTKYNPMDQATHPKEYAKYFVCRKDGKMHWETWNGTTWAYNGSEIIYWKKVNPPVQ